LKIKRVLLCLSVLCGYCIVARKDPIVLAANKTPQSKPTTQTPARSRVQVDEEAQKAKLVKEVSPIVPMFSEVRPIGTVVLRVAIRKHGAVKGVRYVSGPANLAQSAEQAVIQWRYKPTFVNGVPVEVETTVSLVFPPAGVAPLQSQ
jgi:hypothetical protein